MNKDLNKGITEIQYNSLNLPKQMVINSSTVKAKNYYTYSASGVKLRTEQRYDPTLSVAPVGSTTPANDGLSNYYTNKDYVGNIIYETEKRDAAVTNKTRILVDGGYIEDGTYYFYLTDHLGNNRVVADASGTAIQKNHYYPFGMAFAEGTTQEQGKQPYKYNGKELDQMHGLNLYDYSARYYEPAIGRFTTVDPLTEKYYSISPYAFCANNPITLIDPNGLEWFYYSVDGKSDPTWNWRDESEYRTGIKDSDGNEVVLQGQNAVVVAEGASDERLGKGENLFGEGAKLANFTVYGPGGANDIKTYRGLTMSSHFNTFGAIENGEYTVNYRNPGKSGKLKSNWAIENAGPVDCLYDSNPNPIDRYSETQKNGVYFHTSNQNGFAGRIYNKDGTLKGAISTGCILIVPSGHGENGWNEFRKQLSGVSSFHFILNRDAAIPLKSFPVYPSSSVSQLKFPFHSYF